MVGTLRSGTRSGPAMSPTEHEIDLEGLEARIGALPGLAAVREVAESEGLDAYVVGGSVRDALRGAARADLDVAVAGDHLALVAGLSGEARVHDRFGTATAFTPGGPVDVARTRAETYPQPGALPEVRPAGIVEDLGRRDFTINALAIPLTGAFELLDPHGGLGDLGAGLLRVLHERSFADDPTRALRAARYASRLGLAVEPQTLSLLQAADPTTVSAERVEAELRSLAADAAPREGFALLAEWGLIELEPEAAELIEAVVALLGQEPWRGLAPQADAVLAAREGPSDEARELAAARPPTASAAVDLARGASPVTLAHARALGGAWLDEYVSVWRHERLEISGADLLAAGVPEGPAVGAGLAAALRAKLDGEAPGREAQLQIALRAAGAGGPA